MQETLKGKTCLVTGATTGIGKETALAFARLGAKVAVVGRDPERTRETVEAIRKDCGADAESYLADLSSMAEVRRLAADFKRTHDRLHVLVNNAGAVFTRREVTADGYERTWALNHLAYFLLTTELLDLLKASAPARIVNVASRAHETGRIDFDDLQGERSYGGLRAYSQSKLANVQFTYALARRLKGTRVTANAVHPGVVATGFGHNTPGLMDLVLKLARPFLRTPAQGAATTVHVAASPDLETVSGYYFSDSAPAKSAAASHDEAVQERLWQVSLEQTSAAAPR